MGEDGESKPIFMEQVDGIFQNGDAEKAQQEQDLPTVVLRAIQEQRSEQLHTAYRQAIAGYEGKHARLQTLLGMGYTTGKALEFMSGVIEHVGKAAGGAELAAKTKGAMEWAAGRDELTEKVAHELAGYARRFGVNNPERIHTNDKAMRRAIKAVYGSQQGYQKDIMTNLGALKQGLDAISSADEKVIMVAIGKGADKVPGAKTSLSTALQGVAVAVAGMKPVKKFISGATGYRDSAAQFAMGFLRAYASQRGQEAEQLYAQSGK